MKLSIIIPVYNVEKYLKHCLDSCLKQNVDSDSYEIIVVNDGSPDNSYKILDVYSLKYSNIKVVNQNNSGLSVARNNGLKIAKGEYIWFVDSDDSIKENCLFDIYIDLECNPDMLQLNYQYVFEKSGSKPVIGEQKAIRQTMSGYDCLLNGGLPAPAPFTIYKRIFLINNNLFFIPNRLHEDSEFKPRATYFAKSIKWHKNIVYNYLQRLNGSITSSFKLKNAIDLIEVNNRLISFCKGHIKEIKARRCFRRFIGLNINTLLNGSSNLSEADRKNLILTLSKNKQLFKNMMLSNKLKYQVEGLILLLMPKLAFRLYQKFAH